MNTQTKYANWPDEELLREVQNQDPLLTTGLEAELAKRLAASIDELTDANELLEPLNDADITEPDEIQTFLDTAESAKNLLDTHSEQFSDLNEVETYMTDLIAIFDDHEIYSLDQLKEALESVKTTN